MQMHIHLYIYTYICGVRVCVYMYSILSAHMAKSRVQYCLRDAVHLKERQQSSAALRTETALARPEGAMLTRYQRESCLAYSKTASNMNAK